MKLELSAFLKKCWSYWTTTILTKERDLYFPKVTTFQKVECFQFCPCENESSLYLWRGMSFIMENCQHKETSDLLGLSEIRIKQKINICIIDYSTEQSQLCIDTLKQEILSVNKEN